MRYNGGGVDELCAVGICTMATRNNMLVMRTLKFLIIWLENDSGNARGYDWIIMVEG